MRVLVFGVGRVDCKETQEKNDSNYKRRVEGLDSAHTLFAD